MKFLHKFVDINFVIKFHAGAVVFFMLLTIPAVFLWAESVPFLVYISMWALIAAHWSAFQGAHSEKEAKEDNDVDFDDMDRRLDELAQRVEHLIALIEDKRPPEPERCL